MGLGINAYGLGIWGKEYDLCDKVNGNKNMGLGILAWAQY